jgi:hypothetical protein
MSNNPTKPAGKPRKTRPVEYKAGKGPKLVEMPARPVRQIDAVWLEEPTLREIPRR